MNSTNTQVTSKGKFRLAFVVAAIALSFASCTIPPNIVPSGNKTALNCDWECGQTNWFKNTLYTTPYSCENPEQMLADLRADNAANGNKWGDSVYSSSNSAAFHGVWNWGSHMSTTNGWTAWWRGYGRNCSGSFTSNWNSFSYGQTVRMTITKTEKGAFKGALKGKQQGQYLSIAGSQEKNAKSFQTPEFNSPFVYLENTPKGKVSVSVSSENGLFRADPAFDGKNEWNLVNSDAGLADASGKPVSHLFYEFASDVATLSRNGKNFASKAELESFLESGFLSKLGMDSAQSGRSLGYLLPKLPDAKNYYLTVLSGDEVSQFSNLSVSPAPESVRRVMYVVYASDSPVRTSGDLSIPASATASEGFRVTEFGEAVVDASMRVFWK